MSDLDAFGEQGTGAMIGLPKALIRVGRTRWHGQTDHVAVNRLLM
jgi:hypothetical protein